MCIHMLRYDFAQILLLSLPFLPEVSLSRSRLIQGYTPVLEERKELKGRQRTTNKVVSGPDTLTG